MVVFFFIITQCREVMYRCLVARLVERQLTGVSWNLLLLEDQGSRVKIVGDWGEKVAL